MQTITLFDENKMPLPIKSGIPKKYAEFAITGAQQFHVKVADYGMMLFQLVPTMSCNIWVSNYFFTRTTTIYCKSKSPGVEFSNIVTGNAIFKMNNQNWQVLKAGEHNVLFNLDIDSVAIFNISPVTTVDFHLTTPQFKRLIKDQPAFRLWAQRMHQGLDIKLYPNSSKTPLQVQGLIAELIEKSRASLDLSHFALQVVKSTVKNASKPLEDTCLYKYSYEEVKKIMTLGEQLAQMKAYQVDLPALFKETLIGYKKFVEGFKLIYSKTPAQFLFDERMKEAQSLLLHSGRYTNAEIALIMDFNSGSHFATAFKRVIGCTPQQYRRKYLHELGPVR